MITDINAKVIEGAGDTIDALLRMNRDKLNKEFLKEDPLSVSFTMKFKTVDGDVEVDTSMNFVMDRIKDSVTTRVNGQDELFTRREKSTEPAVYHHRERANFPARWWKDRTLPDCRIDAERS